MERFAAALCSFYDWLLAWLLFAWFVFLDLGFNPPLYIVFGLLIGCAWSIILHLLRYTIWLTPKESA